VRAASRRHVDPDVVEVDRARLFLHVVNVHHVRDHLDVGVELMIGRVDVVGFQNQDFARLELVSDAFWQRAILVRLLRLVVRAALIGCGP
jgi:hypothetical protein